MSEDDSVDSPAFIRQRRNVILASLVLAFAQSTHLTIEHVNFFGTSARIDSPVSTTPYLWVLCIYFLWRYWQTFRAEKRPSTIERYKLAKKQYVERVAVKRALAPYRGKEIPLSSMGEPAVHKAWMPDDEEKPRGWPATVVVVTNLVPDPALGQKNIEIDLSRSSRVFERI